MYFQNFILFILQFHLMTFYILKKSNVFQCLDKIIMHNFL